MSQVVKLKYKAYYNNTFFNYKTNKYESEDGYSYSSRGEAKSNQWKCEKCQFMVGSFKKLAVHKVEQHSYEDRSDVPANTQILVFYRNIFL